MWTLLRFALVLPLLVGAVLWRRVRRRSPPRWTFVFEVANEVIRWFLARLLGEFIGGTKRNLPSAPLRGRLASSVERVPTTLAGREAEWLKPRAPAAPCILYLHGGGFVTGSIGTHRPLMARIALASGARVVGLEYRLAPEHRFPAGLEDCVAAYRALLEAGEAPQKLVIAGDSAGGGLAASTLLALKERSLPLPAGAVLISPAVDLREKHASWETNAAWDFLAPLSAHVDSLLPAYLGDADRNQPLASPICGDLSGLPPMLIQVGSREVLHDQVVEFAQKAKAAGAQVELDVAPDMVHVWHAFAGLQPEADAAIARIGQFVQRTTQG